MQRLRGLESRFETCDARMAEFALKKELTDMGKVMSGVIEEVKVEIMKKITCVDANLHNRHEVLTSTVHMTQEQTEAATLDAVKTSEQATEQANQSWQSAVDAKQCLATCAKAVTDISGGMQSAQNAAEQASNSAQSAAEHVRQVDAYASAARELAHQAAKSEREAQHCVSDTRRHRDQVDTMVSKVERQVPQPVQPVGVPHPYLASVGGHELGGGAQSHPPDQLPTGQFQQHPYSPFPFGGYRGVKTRQVPPPPAHMLEAQPPPESQRYLKGHRESPWDPPMATPPAAQERDVPSYREDGSQQPWPYQEDPGQPLRPTMLYDVRRHDTPELNECIPPPENEQPTFPQQWDQTILDEKSWLQIAWCFDEDGYFLPRKALNPPEDLVKLVPTSLSPSWAFTEIRPPEDVMERPRQERNHTSYQGRYPPSWGAIYSTKGHPFLDEQTLERVRKMRDVPKYSKGDSWDAWEVNSVDWFDDVGKHISDIKQVEGLICSQPAEDEEKWRNAKRDFRLDFFGLFRHISVDGRRGANLSEYYQKWRNMSLPPPTYFPPKVC